VSHAATIYVVDDDDAVRDSIRVLLECEGFAVVEFASCADFLRYARPDGRSCIVLDVHMPGMGGLELLDRIRRDKMIMPVIAMTGRPDPAIARAVNRVGAALLEKPFRGDELVRSIERIFRAAEHENC
jgi:FixJ family two-component response regulator